MASAEFISTYQGITYKVPESDKYARFKQGRLVTGDEEVISYLREHEDYGITLTEVEHPGRKGIVAGVDICPKCGRTFKSRETLAEHMEKFHKEAKEDGAA